MKMISLAIADGHDIYRNGLSNILKTEENLTVNIVTSSLNTLQNKLQKNQSDILLLSGNAKGYNVSSVATIKSEFPALKVIVLSNNYNYSVMFSLFQKGINSYLLKNAKTSIIIEAINTLDDNEYYFTKCIPSKVKKIVQDKKFNILKDFNDREIEIIRLICEDKNNNEIAEQVCLTVRTIEWYRRSILSKMNVKTPVGIVKYALNHKFYRL